MTASISTHSTVMKARSISPSASSSWIMMMIMSNVWNHSKPNHKLVSSLSKGSSQQITFRLICSSHSLSLIIASWHLILLSKDSPFESYYGRKWGTAMLSIPDKLCLVHKSAAAKKSFKKGLKVESRATRPNPVIQSFSRSIARWLIWELWIIISN